jgi:flagellin
MRINTNVSAINTLRVLSQTNTAMARSIGRLSSGFRINRAADDAAGLAIANKFRADIRSFKVAQQNVTEATALVQVAEGAVSSIGSILERMKELATQAASANASTQLTALDEEFQALKNEIDRIVESTNYQGNQLIDGTFSGTFQVGATNVANNQLAIDLSGVDLATGQLSIDTDDLQSADNARTAMTNLDAAISTVNRALGTLGALQNRLDYAASNIATTIENYSASESAIRDADMAYEMTVFTRNQILQQAGTAMLAQANAAPQGVLRLLG